jgi:uncharacterized protein Smg (DUF494 family)
LSGYHLLILNLNVLILKWELSSLYIAMQERIVEIIVFLLTELQQERKQKERVDLTRELIHKGYMENEINVAFSWIVRHLQKAGPDYKQVAASGSEKNDDISDIERLVITSEAYGYLLHLIRLGVLHETDVELVLEHALAEGKDDLGVDDLKSIVAAILFNADNEYGIRGNTPLQ